MGKKQKLLRLHINVRQSISLLVLRLIIIQILTALAILFLFFPLPYIHLVVFAIPDILSFETLVFALIILIETTASFFVTVQWLNEYYEIFATKVIHKSGIIFRKEEVFAFEQVKSIGLRQGILGRIFNYGTVSLFDRFLNKHYYLYLIHNPHRCFHIIEQCLPKVEEEKRRIRPRLSSEEEGEEI